MLKAGKTLNKVNVKCFFITCLSSLCTSSQKPSKSKHLNMSSEIGSDCSETWEQHGVPKVTWPVGQSWQAWSLTASTAHLQVNLQIQEVNSVLIMKSQPK